MTADASLTPYAAMSANVSSLHQPDSRYCRARLGEGYRAASGGSRPRLRRGVGLHRALNCGGRPSEAARTPSVQSEVDWSHSCSMASCSEATRNRSTMPAAWSSGSIEGRGAEEAISAASACASARARHPGRRAHRSARWQSLVPLDPSSGEQQIECVLLAPMAEA